MDVPQVVRSECLRIIIIACTEITFTMRKFEKNFKRFIEVVSQEFENKRRRELCGDSVMETQNKSALRTDRWNA